jgi:hypothetical protein
MDAAAELSVNPLIAVVDDSLEALAVLISVASAPSSIFNTPRSTSLALQLMVVPRNRMFVNTTLWACLGRV